MTRTEGLVSIMIPVLNEERHLREVVAHALGQKTQRELEVIIAVGPSRDRTLEIAQELAVQYSNVRVVDNPSGRTPDALNAAIAHTRGEYIVRCDGHAFLPPDYVETAIATLIRTDSDNVGGIMDAQGETAFQKAVAWAMKSPFGVGSAAFHVGGVEGEAETVYLGSFRASALERVGGYDPRMTRAQDWEMNHRIRATGGRVWFNPALKVTYRPRRTITTLAQQYLQYGQWRRLVMHLHPETAQRLSALRYFAPPAAVTANVLGLIVGGIGALFGSQWSLALVVPATYIAGITAVSLSALGKENLSTVMRLPLVLATMHMCWGVGFLFSPAKAEIAKN